MSDIREPRYARVPDFEANRKKSLREPYESMTLAAEAYPSAVLHSEEHLTENAARSAVKRIQAGEGGWDAYPNRVAFVQRNPNGAGWDVYVGFHFKDPDREHTNRARAVSEVRAAKILARRLAAARAASRNTRAGEI